MSLSKIAKNEGKLCAVCALPLEGVPEEESVAELESELDAYRFHRGCYDRDEARRDGKSPCCRRL